LLWIVNPFGGLWAGSAQAVAGEIDAVGVVDGAVWVGISRIDAWRSSGFQGIMS
jgi:hypothetical protein